MNEIVEEGSYRYAFEILMRAFDKNDINFGSDPFFAVNAIDMVRQACTNADIGNYLSFGQWSCFIIEKYPYGTSTVRVDPNTIEKVESDADAEI